MPRIAPLIISSESIIIAALREENDSLIASLAALRERNHSLIASLAALRMRFDALQKENAPTAVVRTLCTRVAEMTANEDAMQRNVQRLQQELEEAAALHKQCTREVENLREQVDQLQGGIAELQFANHTKAAELCRLKKNVARIKEHLTCSISQDVMQKVCVLSTGQAYNRDSIAEWLWRSRSHRCPNTGLDVQWHDYQPVIIPAFDEVCAIVAKM